MNGLQRMTDCAPMPEPVQRARVVDSLKMERERITQRLAELDAAIAALEKHPELEQVLTTLGRTY